MVDVQYFDGRISIIFWILLSGSSNIIKNDEEIILTVNRCTAYEHVRKLVGNVSPNFCDQTIKTNEALAEDTPYEIKTEILGEAACRQTIRKRA